MSATKSTLTVSVLTEAPVLRRETGPSISETCERHAACLGPAESSARNTIETVFCLRRNHISASALNVTSQQMTNGRRVPAERTLTIPGGQKGSCYETMRPMSRKTRIRCPLPYFVERPLVDSCALLLDPLRGSS